MSSPKERIYELTLPIRAGGRVYPGDPAIRFQPHSSIARGDPANVTSLAFGSHTGTHIDAPRHFLNGATTVDEIAISRLVGPAVVLELGGTSPGIGAAELSAHDLQGRRRVLLKTRNSELLRQPGFDERYRALTSDGATYLLDRGVELVGIDYLSVEEFGSEDYPVHHLLLEHGTVIVEGLDLSEVPAGVYRFVCLPLRLVGLDGAPAGAVLIGDSSWATSGGSSES